ncbi:hypothetical protein [Mycolicibacter minnesotensis]|jgi:transcriptional regulator with XRE-family HTH domain
MSAASRTFSQVVGENARRIRLESGATQALVAEEMVRLGLPWGSGRVAQFEAGSASPALPVLLLLACALDNLTPKRRPVTLVDLLEGEEPLSLAPGVSVPPAALVGVVRGGAAGALNPYRRPFGVSGETVEELDATDSYTRTDERAAKELGTNKAGMVKLATALWGRNLSAERDRRAELLDGPVPRVAKARITRELITEAEAELARWSSENTL